MTSDTANISWRDKLTLAWLGLVCYIVNILILYPARMVWLIFFRRYRIRELKTIRRKFSEIQSQIQGPLLICPNHLTFLDPFLVVWALMSFWDQVIYFHILPWNVPKKSYASNLLFLLIFAVGKTILIDRDASAEIKKNTMKKISFLLSKGESVLIFPEGTRSVSGRIEKISYGVGGVLRSVPTTQVLCVYLRGDSQLVGSSFPKKGEQFSCQIKLIQPHTEYEGRRADKDLSQQIIKTLSEMENAYFAEHHLRQ